MEKRLRAQENIFGLYRPLKFSGNPLGIEIDHLPAARAIQRDTVVHLPRINHNDISGGGLNFAQMAPRTLRALSENPDAELVVGMARKTLFRD